MRPGVRRREWVPKNSLLCICALDYKHWYHPASQHRALTREHVDNESGRMCVEGTTGECVWELWKVFSVSLIFLLSCMRIGTKLQAASLRNRLDATLTQPKPQRFTPAFLFLIMMLDDPVSCKMKLNLQRGSTSAIKMIFFFVMEHCQSNHLQIAIKIWSRQHFCN